MSFWDGKEAEKLFKELLFYNAFIEKSCIKRLNHIDMQRELPFSMN